MDDAKVEVSNATYTGSELKPEPTVCVGDRKLEQGIDFDVSYSNNANAGTAGYMITGKGNYKGTVEGTFKISRAVLDESDIEVAEKDLVYNGMAQQPAVTVIHEGRTLVEGKDYTLECSNNVNAGAAKMVINGIGNYEGSVSDGFNVVPVEVSEGDLVIEVQDVSYTGLASHPNTEVVYRGVTLKEGVDYEILCDSVKAGEGWIALKLVGNYCHHGEINRSFRIEPVALTAIYGNRTIKCNEEPGVDVKVAGFVNGETAETASGYEAPIVKIKLNGAGEYVVTPEGGKADNYAFQYEKGRLVVEHADVVVDKAVEPTCTAAGKTEGSHCNACNKVITAQKEISSLGHNVVADKAIEAACITAGKTEGRHCTRCDEMTILQKEIPELGHKVATDAAVAATCTEDGLTEGSHCERCGEVLINQEKIKALGHSWGEWIVVTEATATVAGKKIRSCSTCGATETEAIPSAAQVEASANKQAISQGYVGTEAAVSKSIAAAKSDEGPKGAVFAALQAKAAKTTKSSIKVAWSSVSGAKKYMVYSNACGAGKKFQLIATTTAKSYTKKSLKKGTYHKFLVMAVDSKGRVISVSKTVHVATSGGKVGNAKSVKTAAKKGKVSLKKGKTFKLKATAVPASSKLKMKKHRAIAYESSNSKVATVSSSGTIKAKSKGSCYVYAYAQNGLCAKVKVTVK